MSIDLAPLIFLSHTLFFFFFTLQIFEILISGVSEFLGDEMLSSETAGNKMKKLAPRQRAPALSVLSKPCVFIIVRPFFAPTRLEIQSAVVLQNVSSIS